MFELDTDGITSTSLLVSYTITTIENLLAHIAQCKYDNAEETRVIISEQKVFSEDFLFLLLIWWRFFIIYPDWIEFIMHNMDNVCIMHKCVATVYITTKLQGVNVDFIRNFAGIVHMKLCLLIFTLTKFDLNSRTVNADLTIKRTS